MGTVSRGVTARRKGHAMSLVNEGTKTLETKLPKIVSPTVHGVIDYMHSAFFFAVGLLCSRSNKRAAGAAFATSGFILAQSLFTDYRFGAKPLISFETHGKMDSVFASTSWMLPLLFGFKGTNAAKIFEANSLAEASVVGITDWDSDRAHREREYTNGAEHPEVQRRPQPVN
jgi:hypothetical protein